MLGQRRQLIRGEAPACSLAKFMHCIYPSPITLTRHIYHIINPEDYHQKSIKQQHASLRSAINYICSAEKKKRLKKRRAGGDKEAGADHKAHAAFNKHADDAVIHHIINGAALLPPGRLGATPDWRHAHFLRPPVLIGKRRFSPGPNRRRGCGGRGSAALGYTSFLLFCSDLSIWFQSGSDRHRFAIVALRFSSSSAFCADSPHSFLLMVMDEPHG